ncbi:MAG: lamin tail domain-containing protein, partial [Opitutales bacterium]|nr:lamin tail domain-containing protein [Opitutales bacterium]
MPSSISKSTCVKVCPSPGRWKAPFVFLQWAVFFLCAHAMAEQVVFTEIHYNPPAGKPEFIEVYNNTPTIFDIANWDLK